MRFHLQLIGLIGVLVPRCLRADWRQEWEAELRYRETLLAEWDKLDWRNRLDLLRRSVGALRDALLLQPRRLEDDMFQDLRYGLRMLLKSPGFTLVAVLSLALGIGANTAIFSLLDVVMLKSLPVHAPAQLVLFGKGEDVGLTNAFPHRSWHLFSYPFYREVQQRNEVFAGVAAVQSIPYALHGVVNTPGASGEPEQLEAQLVSGSYFAVLGVPASLGRTLSETDDQTPGGHPVAVVSHAFWTRRLGAQAAAVGQTITIDQRAYEIVGVAPKEFFGTTVGQAPDLWVPLAMEAQLPPFHWNGRNEPLEQSLFLIARLKDGVNAAQANGAVNLLFKQFLQVTAGAQPSAERLQALQGASIELTAAGRGLSELREEFSPSLRVLMVVVVLVLLIACANVANLLLARAAARQKEFAVRLAVGAGRTRLMRQLLTESLLLAGLGGVAGIFLAWWGSRWLVLMASASAEALPLNVTPNARILGFTLLVSVLAALVFGVAPAWRAARLEPNASLKGGKGAIQSVAQSPLGKALVVAQVALSLLLLVGAGLFVRTLINLQNVPTGFNQQNVLQFGVDASGTGYKNTQLATLLRQIEENVRTVPGVQAVSFAFFTFKQGAWTTRAFTRTPGLAEGQSRTVMNNVVGPDYFTVMGIPLVQGRGFNAQDTDTSQKVAVISETMARRFFPNTSPLGQRFGINGPDSSDRLEIVGVVKDVKAASLTEQARPMAYYPHAQGGGYPPNLVVRYAGAPEAVVPHIRQAIKQINHSVAIDEVITLSEQIDRALIQQKLIARLAGFFGLLALLLACVGLYGVLSYAVARRTNEIGIRMALGASARAVRWLVLREALLLVFSGSLLGLIAALFSTRLAASLLFGLKPSDPLTLTVATVVLLAVAALAGYLPARRAACVDPLVALRHE